MNTMADGAAQRPVAQIGGMDLPELPPKDVVDTHLPTGVRIYGYTAEQMREHARASIAARQPVAAAVKDSLTVGGGQSVGQEPVVCQIREVVPADESNWTQPTWDSRQTWREIPKAHYDMYVSVMGGCGPKGVVGNPAENVALELNDYGMRVEVRALYAAPTAQSVDLSMPISMIDRALAHLSTVLDDLESSPDRRPAVMVAETIGLLHQALIGVPNG